MSIPTNLQEAYLEQFNLQLQKQFGANVVTVGYVGELGRHIADFLVGAMNQNVAANPTQAASTNCRWSLEEQRTLASARSKGIPTWPPPTFKNRPIQAPLVQRYAGNLRPAF